MEVEGRGMTLAMGVYAFPGLHGCSAALRREELLLRRCRAQEIMRRKVRELRAVCVQEAEITGKLPKEYPLEPGEMPPHVPWRERGEGQRSDHSIARRELRVRGVGRCLEGSRQPTSLFGGEWHRDRWTRNYGYGPRKGPENPRTETSRSFHNTTDNWAEGPTIGQSNVWRLLPAEVYYHARGRRNSYASPVRMLQRSVSGVGRISQPSSPLIQRERAGRTRYPVSDPPPGSRPAPVSPPARRSSSSEALGVSAPWRPELRRPAPSPRVSAPPPPAHSARHPASARPSDRQLALEGLRDWYSRRLHTAGPDWTSLGWEGRWLTQGSRVAGRGRWY